MQKLRREERVVGNGVTGLIVCCKIRVKVSGLKFEV